jgi:tRNA dimethylallyltransferase
MSKKEFNSIVICGPTACGKTKLAVTVSARLDGEIISADSRQVYRGMDIGTGKDLSEYDLGGRKIPYHCIDIAEPDEVYTLFRYIIDFNRAFNDILSRGKIPVIAGGTGLYIEAAVKQYDVSEVPENKELRDELMAEDTEILAGRLREVSEELYAKTDLSSKKRIVRAIEIARSGQSGSVKEHAAEVDIRPLITAICYPREEIKRRIDLRLESRLNTGMVEEVQRLIDSGISRERLMMLGMEYSCIGKYLLHECSYNEMTERLRNEIHRLAKRQMTWFRGMERRGLTVHWIEDHHEEKLFKLIEEML